jgi:thiol:disulfide interchange protein DsbC
MKRLYFVLFALASSLSWLGAASAAEEAATSADPRAQIAKKFPGVKVEDVKASPVTGMYEVAMGADTAYVSADGKYIIAGDLYEVDTRTNLTESARSGARIKALAKLDERDMIIFKPAVVKHTITVFTDVECGYCRKLHSQIDELNKLGVQVRYLAYPRAGPGTDDWHKMEAVWCSKDRKAAITQAKLGQEVKAPNCATPVAKQYALGEDLGVRGTPAIFTNKGDYIGGYLPPEELVKQLESSKPAKTAAVSE